MHLISEFPVLNVSHVIPVQLTMFGQMGKTAI